MSASVSDVFHYAGLSYWGPLSVARMERVLDLVATPEAGRVLDLGCGRGEALRRLGRSGVGVDRSAAALAEARANLGDAEIELVCDDAGNLAFDDGSFDAALWLGGPYLGGSASATIATLARWVRPGGYVLIGHGFWASPPPPPYLAATGIDAGELGSHADNLETIAAAGLQLLYCCVATRDEWDHFEGTILHNVEQYAAAHPDAPDPDGKLDHRRRWNAAQQRWGRQVMGFGLYLARRP